MSVSEPLTALGDRMSVHINIPKEATQEEADAFLSDLADWAGEWMDDHEERGPWDPFLYAHGESCDDSDHCHGPGSVVERRILERARPERGVSLVRMGW